VDYTLSPDAETAVMQVAEAHKISEALRHRLVAVREDQADRLATAPCQLIPWLPDEKLRPVLTQISSHGGHSKRFRVGGATAAL
jgi:hypothetical protein